MTRTIRKVAAGSVGLLLVVWGVVAIVGVTPASATACTTPVRYAATSNTIYLVSPQVYTLSDIVADCPSAPVKLVDAASKTWELSADMVIQNGATLSLHGDGAQAGPGDVNTLRIRSLASNSPLEVQSISADYGTIDADSVTVTSWDDAAGAPDTNPYLPTGAATTAQGRAFVRAQSFLDTDGTPRQSTMNIVNSTFENLGYYAGESYGVSYKTEGCSHTMTSICDAVNVTGKQINSRFLNNFMGTYTWGARNMTFTGDEYANNIMYGLDTHDVSDNLDIEHNRFDYNGDHGVICSQRCDNLTIEYNESDHNGMVPWSGPDPGDNEDGQVHGIMIHRGVTNTVIAYNNVHDEPTGAGIAVFDCVGDSIHDNTVTNTKYGIRLSVGAANNTITNNTFTNASSYGLYTYQGSDLPENSTPSGHPTGNIFTNNVFDTSGSNIIKLTQTDGTILRGNTLKNAGGSIILFESAGTVLDGNTLPTGQTVALSGISGLGSTATINSLATKISVSVDSYSTADVTSPTGVLYSVGTLSLPTVVTPAGSDVTLSSTTVGTKALAVTPTAYTVLPSSGSATVTPSASGSTYTFAVSAAASPGTLAFSIGSQTPGKSFAVTVNGTPLTTAVVNGSGVLSFSDPSAQGGSSTYVAKQL
jgi:mannuronan 5-epimerase